MQDSYDENQSSNQTSQISSEESYLQQRKSHRVNQENQFLKNKEEFNNFANGFYPQKQSATNRARHSNFETNFIRTQKDPRQMKSKTRRNYQSDSSEDRYEQEWKAKATKEGFLYFHIPGTKSYQWNFPRFYDQKAKRTKPYFVDSWIKKYDHKGKKYWQNLETQHVQTVKPDSETYLIQASILGNLAFLEVYLKAKGNLGIVDQQRRNALHHAVSNGHKEFTALLCNFGRKLKLIESQDHSGATPLFMAIRYNEVECLKILISFDCNLFHRMRNGDTCMHVAAAYNSLNSMIIISNYGGFELFMERNKQGRRPIDVAERMRNTECYQTLQRLERNLQYQNAIIDREIRDIDKVLKGGKSRRSQRNYMEPLEGGRKGTRKEEGYQTTGRHEVRSRSKHVNKLRLDMIEEEDQSNSDYYPENRNKSRRRKRINEESEVSSDSEAELTNLGGYNKYTKRVHEKRLEAQADQHQKSYINKIRMQKTERAGKRRGNKYDSDVPLFSDYDPKTKTFRKRQDDSESQINQSQISSEDQSFVENKKFKQRKNQMSTRGNIDMESFREERDLDKTKNFFHLSI